LGTFGPFLYLTILRLKLQINCLEVKEKSEKYQLPVQAFKLLRFGAGFLVCGAALQFIGANC
jgi:hypothetical protein